MKQHEGKVSEATVFFFTKVINYFPSHKEMIAKVSKFPAILETRKNLESTEISFFPVREKARNLRENPHIGKEEN